MKHIKNFLRFMSGGRIAPELKVGQRWCLDRQIKNPYERNMYTVVVKDIKNGWVKYESLTTPVFSETDTIDHFRWLRDLLPDEKEEYLHCGHPKNMAVDYPGGRPYCSVCNEFVEEKDRVEAQRWYEATTKPLQDFINRMNEFDRGDK